MEAIVLNNLFQVSTDDDKVAGAFDPKEVLAKFDLATLYNDDDVITSQESLVNYLQSWGRQLELSQDKSLPTPILVTDFRNVTRKYDEIDPPTVTKSHLPMELVMTLSFRPSKRYLSYKEQKGLEKGIIPDRKGAKVDAWSPGGVELILKLVEEEEKDEKNKSQSLEDDAVKEHKVYHLMLSARRCDIDDDTIVKFSSERVIMRRLKEAIRIWLKVREMQIF